ncbi:uncharacterized protein [Brachyistius frenatus]|uniref:uncharacterized protein n=1 Tax=Brachyistius frenatus TaxID=100188 RepID=UPI0037E89598
MTKASNMYGYILSAISCVCIFHSGLSAEKCSRAVVAKRETFYVPAGGSVSLSCVVQHCGETWTGSWMRKNSTDENFRTVQKSARCHLTNVTLSDNETKLVLNILRVNQLDEGSYGCKVTWGEGQTDQGNLMNVNVTTAVPSQRTLWHRVLVCAGASLCLPIILGLARCLSSEVKSQLLPTSAAEYTDQTLLPPQPPPRCPVPQKRQNTSFNRARPKHQQKTEEVKHPVLTCPSQFH